MKKIWLALFFVFPAIAFAECNCEDDEYDEYGDPLPYVQYSYLGLNGGYSDFGSSSLNRGSRSIGAYYGHRYSEYFAAEIDYAFLGTFSDPVNAITGHATAVTISALHHFDFNNSVSLYGKLGIGHTVASTSSAGGKSLTEPSYGFGFDIKISRDWMMRLSNDYYAVGLPSKTRVINTRLGFAYRF